MQNKEKFFTSKQMNFVLGSVRIFEAPYFLLPHLFFNFIMHMNLGASLKNPLSFFALNPSSLKMVLSHFFEGRENSLKKVWVFFASFVIFGDKRDSKLSVKPSTKTIMTKGSHGHQQKKDKQGRGRDSRLGWKGRTPEA